MCLLGFFLFCFSFQKGLYELSSQHLFGKRSKLVWYVTYAWYLLPFWYLYLFLSLLLKEETPLESQWERLVRLRLTAMASVCLILLSMFGVCVRTVCVHGHVCTTRHHIRTIVTSHMQTMRNILHMSITIVNTMKTRQGVGGAGLSLRRQPALFASVESCSLPSAAVCNADKKFSKINLALSLTDESQSFLLFPGPSHF